MKQYAIIRFESDEKIFPIINSDGTLMTFANLKEADDYADAYDEQELKYDTRVISIGGVTEDYDSEFDDNGTRKDCEHKADCIRDCYSCDLVDNDCLGDLDV